MSSRPPPLPASPHLSSWGRVRTVSWQTVHQFTQLWDKTIGIHYCMSQLNEPHFWMLFGHRGKKCVSEIHGPELLSPCSGSGSRCMALELWVGLLCFCSLCPRLSLFLCSVCFLWPLFSSNENQAFLRGGDIALGQGQGMGWKWRTGLGWEFHFPKHTVQPLNGSSHIHLIT